MQRLYDLAAQQNIEVLTFPMEKSGSMSIMDSDGRCFVGMDPGVQDGSTKERVHLAHELGHLLAYRLLKLTWVRLSLSLWVLEKGKGLRLDGSRPLFSGSCTCAYDPSLPLRRYSLALVSGGITTLLLGAAALVGAAVSGGSLASFLLCFGVVAVLGGIYNLLPFSADRKLLRQIKQESEHTA